jgi:hypothetical protein
VGQGAPQVAFRIAAETAPVPEHPFQRGLQQVLTLLLAAASSIAVRSSRSPRSARNRSSSAT